ncbi:hypothetical protein PLEOSDRAFT_1111715 [Pleurotus ostreatus PC15]|uniref:F-box domain-containing protein n=1 Tax=Pleurotus ostreatus (strain PC15) TaxID=1137138 RepID=A0A067NW25_PLEO1|nr:hypothetical protein PLEOSDRAFT_1111715 [Pleurotus ostreatus PC15]
MAQGKEQKLPIELIHHIVSLVDGRSNLAACSLVCRDWSEVCRPYIFDNYTIFLKGDNIVSRLLFLHFTAPHLSEYIAHVDLTWNTSAGFLPDWIPKCFRRFKNLRSLYLDEGITSLSSIPLPLALGITSLLSAPRIKELSILEWAIAEDSSELVAMLASCCKTLERLMLQGTYVCDTPTNSVGSGLITAPPSIVLMEALRSLELFQACHPTLDTCLRCPKLESLEIRTPTGIWQLPTWVPDGLQELSIYSTARRFVPNLGKVIHPALLAIRVSGYYPYSMFTSWIQECINLLPFPDRLRRFKIHIGQLGIWSEVPYPQPSDYGVLLRILQQLLAHGSLERIDLKIVITMEAHTRPAWEAGDQVREASKLLVGLAPLLEAKVLHAVFIFQRWRDMDLEVLWSWSEPYFKAPRKDSDTPLCQ